MSIFSTPRAQEGGGDYFFLFPDIILLRYLPDRWEYGTLIRRYLNFIKLCLWLKCDKNGSSRFWTENICTFEYPLTRILCAKLDTLKILVQKLFFMISSGGTLFVKTWNSLNLRILCAKFGWNINWFGLIEWFWRRRLSTKTILPDISLYISLSSA